MLRTIAVTDKLDLLENVPLASIQGAGIKWYWVDFDCPTPDEVRLLDSRFHFHPLAIEDCLQLLQRPKVEHYGDTNFFVLHAIDAETLKTEEVNLFLGPRGIVTFHLAPSREVDEVFERLRNPAYYREQEHHYIAYLVMDALVDNYFPTVYRIEDQLNELDNIEESGGTLQMKTDRVYRLRADLLRIRRTIVPMRDLLYRVISSDKIHGIKEQAAYFTDIHDHLLKLSEMIEANREMTADLRDSYASIRSTRMNAIMKTLTVITTIFMPLTFIVGIYGMNFVHMPELQLRYGYLAVIVVMALLGTGMFVWFKHKGWFD